MGKFIDLTGEKFGKLKVKYRGENSKSGKVRWWCECDCGNTELVLVTTDHLKSGHTKSCGCITVQRLKTEMKEHNKSLYGNKYDLTGEYGIGYDINNNEFYFDLEDYIIINRYIWHITYDQNGIPDVKSTTQDNKTIRMSRLVMNCPNDKVVDHIHGSLSRNDNRKSNLRITDNLHNSINSGLQKNNKSGVTGVFFSKRENAWKSYITVNKKRIFLGTFNIDNFDDAVKARKEAEEKYFGEFSYDNSQKM